MTNDIADPSAQAMTINGFEEHDRRTLSFKGLIEHLSRTDNLPSSIHMRSMLLAPFASDWFLEQTIAETAASSSSSSSVQGQGEKESDKLDQWRWDISEKYRLQPQIAVIGRRVPDEVLSKGQRSQKQQRNAEMSEQEEPYAVLLLSYMLPAGSSSHADLDRVNPERWRRPHLSLWMSSQKHDRDGTAPLSTATRALLDHILFVYLPTALQRLGETATTAARNPPPAAAESGTSIALGAMYRPIVRYWQEERGVVERSTEYTNYHRQVQRESRETVDGDADWLETPIQSDADARLAQSINKIPYPTWYVDAQRPRSILLRDITTPGQEIPGAGEVYARERARGATAGWAFVHVDMSLSSLHVAPAYRRLLHSTTPTSDSNANGNGNGNVQARKKSVGHICVDRMEPLIIEAQRTSFERARLDAANLPAEYFLATETHDNVAARRFFEKLGFVAFMESSWGTMLVPLQGRP